jgi:prepilin-type N-terminal cleavage/methylation domain-containing protein
MSCRSVWRNARGFSLLETLLVLAIMGVIAAIAIPMSGNTVRYIKLSGDARDLSNATALAKMRAASKFSQSRLYVDISGKTYYIQTYDKTTASWVTDGGSTQLSSTVSFGYGPVSSAPSNTQTTIGQASQCMTTGATPAAVANTACIIFNSRGIPIVDIVSGSPQGDDALYLTDGTAVYGVTVAATGFIRLWRTNYTSTPSWAQQ